jgi:Zn-dependent protease with chaperone function
MIKYRPGLPDHNSNVSHNSPFKEFLTLLISVLAFLYLIYWALGFAIDAAANHLPYEQEARLFNKMSVQWGELFGEAPKKDERIQTLVNNLQRCSSLPIPISISTIANTDANAIALPGGEMLVFEGLLEYVQSENGLAFVLAHELGHFINRDHLKGLGRGLVLASLSSMLTGPNSSISQLLTPGIQLNTARFSQKRESAADLTALEILNCHYGHVSGAIEFFESVQKLDQGDSGIRHYFSSHPQVKKRIQAIHKWQTSHQIAEGKTIAWED